MYKLLIALLTFMALCVNSFASIEFSNVVLAAAEDTGPASGTFLVGDNNDYTASPNGFQGANNWLYVDNGYVAAETYTGSVVGKIAMGSIDSIHIVIYDSGGNKLYTSDTTVSTNTGLTTCNFTGDVTITSGQTYYLAVSSGDSYTVKEEGANETRYATGTFPTAPSTISPTTDTAQSKGLLEIYIEVA